MIYIKRTAIAAIIGILILAIAAVIILFSRGYRFNLINRQIGSKGILVANSAPNNAQIYVNNKFVSLTSDNVYLSPGIYEIGIKKEGYSAWQKQFAIKGEVVSRVDAQLFSSNPSLTPLTNSGTFSPYLSPLKDKIAYIVLPEQTQLPLEETGGLMIANLKAGTLNFFRQHNQIVPYSSLPIAMIPEKTQMIFSPDSKNLMAFFYDEFDNLLAVYLLNTNSSNGEFLDITVSYLPLLNKWWLQKNNIQEKLFDTAKPKIRKILKTQTYLVELSPDKSKFLYFSLSDATLPRAIKPPLIGSVPTDEVRNLKAGNFYIYDKKEDKNFLIKSYTKESKNQAVEFINNLKQTEDLDLDTYLKLTGLFDRLIWYPDSRHLVSSQKDTISVVEYDDQNKTLVYSGPFENKLLATSSDGRIVILTNINPKKNKLPDLYSVSIK